MSEASAVLRGNPTITQDEGDRVAWLSKWINYDFKELDDGCWGLSFSV
jgi:hypothetical protein